MAGWPSLDDSLHDERAPEDQDLVRALRARSTDATTLVYDRYGAQLFDYCHALLRDQDTAAEVLHDCLLSARAHIDQLQHPDELRGWLYALARRECRRRLRALDRTAPRSPAPEMPDDFASPEERKRHLEARVLAHSALGRLSGRQREAADLTIRHGLSDTELAGVLGLTAEEAFALGERARKELAEAVSSQVGHDRIQLSRLLSVLPIAMPPADLDQRIAANALDPQMDQDRAAIEQRAAPFAASGWPVEEDSPAAPRTAIFTASEEPEWVTASRSGTGGGGGGVRRQGRDDGKRLPPFLIPLGGVLCVALVVIGLFVLVPGGDDNDGKPNAGNTELVPDDAVTDDPLTEETDPPLDEDETPSTSPSPSTSAATTPTPAASAGTPKPSLSPKPKPTKPTKPPVKPGTATVGGCDMGAEGTSCAVSITAHNGKVTWTASTGGPLAGGGSGTLNAGASGSVTITLTRADPCVPGTGYVTFTPGGQAAVSWGCPAPVTP